MHFILTDLTNRFKKSRIDLEIIGTSILSINPEAAYNMQIDRILPWIQTIMVHGNVNDLVDGINHHRRC